MKKIVLFLLAGILVAGLAGCPGHGCTGLLIMMNTSERTPQEFIVDGRSLGVFQPGWSLNMPVRPGEHVVSFKSVSGGAGCPPVSVVIEECGSSETISCPF
jgi:hypothetical protein